MTIDNRRPELSHVRAMVSAMQAQCDKLRESWPDRYPVPVEVDAAYSLEDAVIAQARGYMVDRISFGNKKVVMVGSCLDFPVKRQQ